MIKDWLFDENLSSTRITLGLLINHPSVTLPAALVGRNGGRLLFVCIYDESTPAACLEKVNRYENGEVEGMHAGISYSPFYSVYSACG